MHYCVRFEVQAESGGKARNARVAGDCWGGGCENEGKRVNSAVSIAKCSGPKSEK
jgi:hypothetical protein